MNRSRAAAKAALSGTIYESFDDRLARDGEMEEIGGQPQTVQNWSLGVSDAMTGRNVTETGSIVSGVGTMEGAHVRNSNQRRSRRNNSEPFVPMETMHEVVGSSNVSVGGGTQGSVLEEVVGNRSERGKSEDNLLGVSGETRKVKRVPPPTV
jgi:hypothetical protein